MLINKETTLSLRCPACGILMADYVHAFSFSGNRQMDLECSCGQKKASIFREDNDNYILAFLCAICEQEHILSYSDEEIWRNIPRPLKCREAGIQVGKLGPQKGLIGKLETIAEHMQGDDFFINPGLVLNILDRLQGLAIEGKLFCYCGSQEVHVDLFADRIKLICQDCAGELLIAASREEDLENITRRNDIVLPGYSAEEKRGGRL